MLVAEEQTAGRGRLDRALDGARRAPGCSSPYCCGPEPDGARRERWGWLPLLAGVATATGLARAAGVDTVPQMAQRPAGHRRRRGAQDRRHPRRAGRRRRASSSASASTSRCAPTNCRPGGRLARPRRTRSPPTATRCCGPCCARWSSGTATGARPAATRRPAGSRRRTRRAARRSAGTVRAELPGGRDADRRGGRARRRRAPGAGHGGRRAAGGRRGRHRPPAAGRLSTAGERERTGTPAVIVELAAHLPYR